ncbi:IucA / IucC family protein [Actinomadura rubteroloni]|uniref:IucA / IucC family protein n=1 Tax=Actinomadura rubteroloni TaxID=1926885 RepID=A0A2P4UIE6_9ACTN|nr:IucA/IucC family protein [Actinomadura rubteroloni]POM24824.1 IucA / IucC family protein [Actinomadura rubteroloni]
MTEPRDDRPVPPRPHPDAHTTEALLAARVLDALLREDYAGLRSRVHDGVLKLPARDIPLRPGTTSDWTCEPTPPHPDTTTDRTRAPGPQPDATSDRTRAPRLLLEDVFAAVRVLADPRDDVDAFERECRDALAAHRVQAEIHAGVLARLRGADRLGPGVFYDTLAAFTDHPVHPLGRARTGLTAADLERYAPEHAPEFALRWTRAPRVAAAGTLPSWWPGDLFPVHPLTVPLLDGAMAGPATRVRPTLSMRTVAVDPLTHVKVPLPTSTLGLRNRRTIVPATLADGALAERVLRRVLDREPHLPVVLADEQTYGHAGSPLLGYLVRRFPAEIADKHVVPVAALLAEDPDGGPVIARWDVAALFRAYLDALFTVNVTLFRYGIALEAHQQNVALVLGDDPRDVRLLIKDNDGMLADAPFTDVRMRTRDPEALARVFTTITLRLCAAAPAFELAARGLLPDAVALVRDRLDAALAAARDAAPDAAAGPSAAFLRARTLDAPRLPAKAMLTAGTLVDKARTGAADINKHYGPSGPNYLRDATCC